PQEAIVRTRIRQLACSVAVAAVAGSCGSTRPSRTAQTSPSTRISSGQSAEPRAGAGDDPPPSSYLPVIEGEPFLTMLARLKGEKAEVERQHASLLADRYDLADRAAVGVTMSRGKPIQGGVRVRLVPGTTWDKLASTAPETIRAQGTWPKGFLPL